MRVAGGDHRGGVAGERAGPKRRETGALLGGAGGDGGQLLAHDRLVGIERAAAHAFVEHRLGLAGRRPAQRLGEFEIVPLAGQRFAGAGKPADVEIEPGIGGRWCCRGSGRPRRLADPERE
jgi:hypothetical protein